jgi:hypothetical protein
LRLANLSHDRRRDAVALIISQNVNRRHQTKGSVAVAVALEFPNPEEQGRGKKGFVAKHFMVDKAKLSQARLVVRHTPALADEVLAGQMGLDKAYDEARKAKAKAEDHAEKVAQIVAEAPDLAEQVEKGKEVVRSRGVRRDLTKGEKAAALRCSIPAAKVNKTTKQNFRRSCGS